MSSTAASRPTGIDEEKQGPRLLLLLLCVIGARMPVDVVDIVVRDVEVVVIVVQE